MTEQTDVTIKTRPDGINVTEAASSKVKASSSRRVATT